MIEELKKELPWQIRIFNKSLKKKQKLNILKEIMPSPEDKIILDLGCAKGTLSYFMREMRGKWISADLDMPNLISSIELLGKNVIQIDPYRFCFDNSVFDMIVTLDFLEHVENDRACIVELSRVLKSGGFLLISTPNSGSFLILNKIKDLVGLTLDKYGHVREGYSPDELKNILSKNGFNVIISRTYSKFFTELIELILNLGYTLLTKNNVSSEKRDGNIAPSSEEDFEQHKTGLKFHRIIYPLLHFITKFDKLLFFTKGYATLILAKKK